MGVFGLDYFGVGSFGNANSTAFTAANFTATPVNYDTLVLSWQQVTNYGSGVPGNWDSMMLLRSSYGHPTNIYDGTVLFTDAANVARTVYTDNQGLKQGRFYYYTLFVHDTVGLRWAVAGRTIGLVTTAWTYGDYMFSRIPSWLQEADGTLLTASQPTYGPLQRFLRLFGSQFDRVRTEIETLSNTYNLDLVSGGLLPLLAYSLNVPAEPEIGVKQLRIIVRNAVHLTRYKGTATGVNGIASAYTGYGAVSYLGANLMLDENESSFEQGIGTWVATGAALSAVATGTGVTPFQGTSMLQVAATGAVTLNHGQAPGGNTKVPVAAGRSYAASAYFQTPTGGTGRACTVQINWFDKTGTALSNTGAGASVTDSPGGWARASVVGVAPANAVFATTTLTIAAAGTETHFVDAVQLEQGFNHLSNATASFEDGSTGGWVAINATLSNTTVQAYDGTHALQISSSAAGNAGAQTATGTSGFRIRFPGDTYTATAQVRAAALARTAQISITWYDGSGATISSTPVPVNVSDSATAWRQITVQGVAPANSVYASISVLFLATAAAAEIHYIDAVGLARTANNLSWAGVTAASAYQPARDARVYLTAQRINLSTNPSFESSTNNWTGTNSTLARVNTVTAAQGSWEMSLVSTGTAAMSAVSALLLISPGTAYTVSAYFQAAASMTVQPCTVTINWYDINQVLISSTSGTAITDAIGSWVRPSVTATSPATAYFLSVTLSVATVASSQTHYVDGILVESSGFVNAYFDGLSLPSTDYSWAGTVNESTSYYYPRRDIATGRLQNIIPQWLPLPDTFTLLYSVPLP